MRIVSLEFTIFKSLIAGTTFFLTIKPVPPCLRLSHWPKEIIVFPISVKPCPFHLISCKAKIFTLYLLNSLTTVNGAPGWYKVHIFHVPKRRADFQFYSLDSISLSRGEMLDAWTMVFFTKVGCWPTDQPQTWKARPLQSL